jgi:hypothetical protein
MKRKTEVEEWNQFFEVMGNVPADRADARAITEGEELTVEMRQPGRDVSKKAGRIERDSPLFYGKGDNPLLFND